MKYLSKSFSTPANSRAYVDGWEATFGEKRDEFADALYDLAEQGMPVRACKSCGHRWLTQRGAGTLTCECGAETEFYG